MRTRSSATLRTVSRCTRAGGPARWYGHSSAEIFRHRRDVLFASIHQLGLFPGTGAITDAGSGDGRGYTINIPRSRRIGHETWISVLEYVIIPAALEFSPQLVLISAGYDAHRGTAESIAPDPFVTSRAAAHIGHYWTL